LAVQRKEVVEDKTEKKHKNAFHQRKHTMKTLQISKLQEHINQTITLQGWVHTVRDQKQMQFIILRNSTTQVQIVNLKSENPSLAKQITSLTRESVITATGHTKSSDTHRKYETFISKNPVT
jgi:aspartyl/asparaginyl-tRNA synthetase